MGPRMTGETEEDEAAIEVGMGAEVAVDGAKVATEVAKVVVEVVKVVVEVAKVVAEVVKVVAELADSVTKRESTSWSRRQGAHERSRSVRVSLRSRSRKVSDESSKRLAGKNIKQRTHLAPFLSPFLLPPAPPEAIGGGYSVPCSTAQPPPHTYQQHVSSECHPGHPHH